MNTSTFSLTVLAVAAALGSHANNIQVSNTTLVDNLPMAGTMKIQFDLSWENSWRGMNINNWDAAWVFVKYRTPAGLWYHVRLESTGHMPASGSHIDPGLLTPGSAYNATSNPVLGVFVYRAQDGTGTFTANATQLSWNYGAAGINYIDISEVQVFAIEMVYVPQGTFAAGALPSGLNQNFTLTTINTANATTAPSGSGSLGGLAGGYPTGENAPTTANWPNGYGAFYCMKYELSQQGYVDFLNTLTYAQQVSRTANPPLNAVAGTGSLITGNLNRNGIDISVPALTGPIPATYACNLNGNSVYGEVDDGKDIACNYLSWGDHGAYLDWSGLRPMTELEHEKACRGSAAPITGEFPWGTTAIDYLSGSPYTLSDAGTPTENVATNYDITVGNAHTSYSAGTIDGPLRTGIFASHPSNSGRMTSGATYYGIMEMGGNLNERTVTLTDPEGRLFNESHGNGILTTAGDADAGTWADPTTGDGTGLRGGSWETGWAHARTADRSQNNWNEPGRWASRGTRGVRSAP